MRSWMLLENVKGLLGKAVAMREVVYYILKAGL